MILKVIIIGIGATLLMDIWSFLQRVLFNAKSLDYRLLGRWIGHFSNGQIAHNTILSSKEIPYEKAIGWLMHYLIGIGFTFLLVFIWGEEWLNEPTIIEGIYIGLLTMIAPFFIMQPCFGFGIAASKVPNPNVARFKSLLIHVIYGAGLYLFAVLMNEIL